MATQDDYIRTALRVPPALHAKIHEAAKANNRTFNAEILARLEQAESVKSESNPNKSNGMLLRMLAGFVLLQKNHPQVMSPMEETIISMCQTIAATKGDADILDASRDSFISYTSFLTQEVEKTNEQLGPGWAKRQSKKNQD